MGKMKFRIEPELMYCPQCNDEYRAGIEKCASCEVDLLNGVEMLARLEGKSSVRNMEISADDQLVDIIKGQIINIKNLQSLLKSEGFPSIIAGDSNSCGKGCCGGGEVRLQIRADDVQGVMEVMAREHVHSTGLMDHDTSYVDSVYNTDSVLATCPACGCQFATDTNSCPDCGLCF